MSGSTAHSKHHKFQVQELYDPEFVTLEVPSTGRTFRLVRHVITDLSEYFKGAFKEGAFREGRAGRITLDHDDEDWIVECFVGWLYSQELTMDPAGGEEDTAEEEDIVEEDDTVEKEDMVDEQNNVETLDEAGDEMDVDKEQDSPEDQANESEKAQDDSEEDQDDSKNSTTTPDKEYDFEEEDFDDEEDNENPITWKWSTLIRLYIFADKYSTKGFRETILQTIQLKVFQNKPRNYDLPNESVKAYAFNNLTPSSKLFCFLVDLTVHFAHPADEYESMEKMPQDALARIALGAIMLARHLDCPECKKDECENGDHVLAEEERREFFHDPCTFHEHETEGESLCRLKWEGLKEKHGLQMDPKLRWS